MQEKKKKKKINGLKKAMSKTTLENNCYSGMIRIISAFTKAKRHLQSFKQ